MGGGCPSARLPCEYYNNTGTLFPWKFTEDIIYLIKNTPKDDNFVLIILDEPSPDKYDDDEDNQRDNN